MFEENQIIVNIDKKIELAVRRNIKSFTKNNYIIKHIELLNAIDINSKKESKYINISNFFNLITKEKINLILNNIAQKVLNIETLDTQHNDKKDFHNLSVWQIKDALMEAYKIGHEKDEKC